MILGATDQKLWVFKVFGQGLARAAMYCSEPAKVDHLHKNWRAGEKKNSKKRAVWPCPGVDSRLATSSQTILFFVFCFFLLIFFRKFGEWARDFGRMGVQHPHFLKPALHLEVFNVPFFVEIGDFIFFQFLFFLN
jgi:hypothetical protein